MIPKTLHYVWVGKNPFPQSAKNCLNSWKKHLPDFEIKLWNEDNALLDHPYVERMYVQKKWAFVSDYIRFKVLYEEGGIYVDTDTEVLRSLEPLLKNEIFFGRTSSDGYISCGIIGATPKHPFIAHILAIYDQLGASDTWMTSPQIVEKAYAEYNKKEDITIYEPKYFYPCNAGEQCTSEMLKDAYTNHHWDESWVNFRMARRIARSLGLIRLFKKLRGV